MLAKDDADLAALARAYGVSLDYENFAHERVHVSAQTTRKVLASLDVDASTPAKCRKALADLVAEHWHRTLPPVLVLRQCAEPDAEPWEAWVHSERPAATRLWVELEDGARRSDIVRTSRPPEQSPLRGHGASELTYRIPRDLPLGWHKLFAETPAGVSSCALVITPERLTLPASLAARRGWGVATQLYSIRSHHSWGLGDLADLSDLAAWFANQHGADLLLVNPLHASSPVAPMEASPYLPVTRRYVNPLYLRIEMVEEFGYLTPEQHELVERLGAPLRALNHSSDLLDRDAAWLAKRQALEYVHTVELTPGRQAQFDGYRANEGAGLRSFATWCALAEEYGSSWEFWPPQLQNAGSAAVAVEAERLAHRIEFYEWLQWLLDEQMAHAQNVARDSGMEIGVMHDLAVGVHRFGADTWSEPDVLARGVTVGAPPDRFNQIGQDWSQPPRRPDELAAAAYEPYRDMLRTLLRHSGGLRIDHVLGLFRLWWIPVGGSAADGTYVRYDHHAMVNILVLEAQRAGAVIVGEDLGTVEPWVRDFLAERGILGTIIMYFEREKDGRPKPPEEWRPNAMASVTVHDIPPSAGYIAGDHVELRHRLKLLKRSFEDEAAAHQAEIQGWRDILVGKGLLRPDADVEEFIVAMHRAMTWSPSKLLAIALPDLVGERQTQNQPGTSIEYPNWRVPLCDASGRAVLIEDLPTIDHLSRIVSAVGASKRTRPVP